jgi:transposase
MDQRVPFIADYQRDVFDVAELARRYGISRKTAYKWLERYDSGGPAALADRSHRPARCPHAIPGAVVAALLEVRRHHPTWGAKKLIKVVARRQLTWTLPARSTVCDLLDRGPGDRAVAPDRPAASGTAAGADDHAERHLDRRFQRAVQERHSLEPTLGVRNPHTGR